MHYQASTSPTYQNQDQWSQWHHSPYQYQHPYFGIPNNFNGTPENVLHPRWHQQDAPYDYGSTWSAQTPLTASASSPTSLSRTASWPTFPPPSTWTSPITSPECGLPHFATSSTATTTPFLVGVEAAASNAQTTALAPVVSYGSHTHPFDPHYPRHHTPIAYRQMDSGEVCQSRPSFSSASSPTMFSHHTSQQAEETNPSRLSGLGIGSVQDLAYPVYIKEDEQSVSPTPPSTPTDTASARRHTKRRRRKESSSSFRRYRPFHCPYCTFSFDRKCNLTCHLKTHGVGRGRVTCPEEGCGKEYGRQADVNRHIRTVHHGASFTCDDCGKNFGRNDILMRHEEACAKRKERLGGVVEEEEEELEEYF